MASALGAALVANAEGVTDNVLMKYKTFTLEHEVATTQQVTRAMSSSTMGWQTMLKT